MNSPRLTNILLTIIGILLAVVVYVFYQNWQATHITQYDYERTDSRGQQNPQQVVPVTTTPINNMQGSNSGQVQLDLSTEFARNFKTRLAAALNSPANYWQHHVMVEIGCGSSCMTYAAVDKDTGKVYSAPFKYDDGYEITYGLESDLVVVKDAQGRVTYYVLDPTDGFQIPDGMRY